MSILKLALHNKLYRHIKSSRLNASRVTVGLCSCGDVQGEAHVLCHCPLTEHLRIECGLELIFPDVLQAILPIPNFLSTSMKYCVFFSNITRIKITHTYICVYILYLYVCASMGTYQINIAVTV